MAQYIGSLFICIVYLIRNVSVEYTKYLVEKN